MAQTCTGGKIIGDVSAFFFSCASTVFFYLMPFVDARLEVVGSVIVWLKHTSHCVVLCCRTAKDDAGFFQE